jgi:hypothetical protein
MKNLLLSLFIAFSLFAEAQVSKIIDAGGSAVVTKASANYAKVFKRKKGTATEYIWYTTDANGKKLSRGGQVKGTTIYSSLATAEAAIPANYTLIAGGGNGGDVGTVVGDFVVQFDKGFTNDQSYQYDFTPWIGTNGEVRQRLAITVTTDYKLQISINTTGFADIEQNMRFKTDADLTSNFNSWMTKAELEAKDFSALKGKDIMVIMGHIPSGYTFPWVVYTLVHLKGDATTNLPTFFKRSGPSIRLPQAPYTFLTVTPLASKVNIMQFQQLDANLTNVSGNYLSKGYTIGNSSDISKTYTGIYDDWAYANGALRWADYPAYKENYKNTHGGADPPFADAHQFNVNWVKTHTIQELFSYFNSNVISPNNGKGFLFLDYEFVAFSGLDDQDFVNKMGTLFREFKNRNPNTLFTSYVNADPAKITYDFNLSAADVTTNNAKYDVPTANFSQIATGFFAKTVNYLNVDTGDYLRDANGNIQTGNMGQYIEPVVNLYMHNLNSTNLYSAINEFEVTSKNGFKPLAFVWGLNEGLPNQSDWNAYSKNFQATNGTLYAKQVKTPTPASYMWNTVLMSNFFGRGAWVWDEPLPFVEGFDYYDFAFPLSGGDVQIPPNRSPAPNFGVMHYAAQTAYDYATWAIQRMIHNGDIIENTQPITMPEYSIDNGVSYKTGDLLKPASAEYNKLPIVRLKKHATLNEYVIFAVNHHLKTWETQTLKVKVADKIITVTLKGQFAEFERIR